MNSAASSDRKWNERPSAAEGPLADTQFMFQLLFERSADAIVLFDPQAGVFVDANSAAVALLRAASKEQLLNTSPADLAPPLQADGRLSREKSAEITALIQKNGSHRFEWLARRFDGTDVPLECLATAVPVDGRTLHVVVPRDISQRKRAEEEIRQLNQTLEQRVAERTAELRASEAQFRTLVEHAPEAIVVFDGQSGRVEMVNEHAVRLFGHSREELLRLTPADVSPPLQPDGRSSAAVARERMDAALADERPVFEWLYRHANGRLFISEVRLVRLPGERCCLLRASIIDHTEQKRREQVQRATYEISEAVHSAEDLDRLYARIHDIVGGLMPAKNFYIALLDPVTELISFPYFVDEQADECPSPRRVGTGLTGVVLRTGKPLLLGRSMTQHARRVGDTVWLKGMDVPYVEAGVEAAVWLGVPLLSQGRAFGVMAVQDYREETAYDECDRQILNFVAEQTALAIERKRAQQALLRSAEQVRRHRNVLLELAKLEKFDLPTALATICARAAATLNLSRVGYWSLQDNGASLVCEMLYERERGGCDASIQGTRIALGDCPAYQAALQRNEVIVAHQAMSHPDTSELADNYLRPLGITSMLDVPVWWHGEGVGVLCHEHMGEPREWATEEIDFATSVATMVSLSLEAAQRARSDKSLRESEEKFRALFEATSTGVMLHDEEQFLEVNPAIVRMLGYQRAEDLIGKHPRDFSPPSQPDGQSSAVLAARHITDCLEKGVARFEWVALSAHGEPVPIEVILTRVEMGGRRLIQAVVTDIAERKKAEEELRASAARLRESEARFSAAFRASQSFITISRMSDGRWVDANDAFLHWSGFTRDEVLGRDSQELGLWPDLVARAQFWGELKATGAVRGRECEIRTRRGSVQTVLLAGDVIEINGEPHALLTAVDITERKRAEAELLKALAREQELGQLKSSFVSMVSHEFRTPLGVIQSSAQILTDYLDQLDPGERQEHLLSIAKNTRRMADMMEEVLVLSRLDAGKMEFQPAPLNLRRFSTRLVDEVLSATSRMCPIELRVGDMPDEASADERLVRHILTNLLSNAVKYSEPGRPVEFSVDRDGAEAVFIVRDHGIGIPEADQAWLFSAFHRGSNVGPRAGTGLGLVIVKRCVELHGGKIRVGSKVGEGTTMTVRLPLFTSPANL